MGEFLTYLTTGLTNGAIYALVALGFTLIYTSTRIFNFAQGAFVMVAAMAAAVLTASGLSIVAVLPILLAGAVVFGVVFEQLAIRPLVSRGAPPVMAFVSTLAIALILTELAARLWGTQERSIPELVSGPPLRVLDAAITLQTLVLWGVAALIAVAVAIVYYRTRLGVQIRAVGRDPYAATLSGISGPRIVLATVVASALISALAAWAYGPLIAVSAAIGLNLAIKGFIAAILGGMGNPFGAYIGGFGLGILESFAAGYISTTLASVIAFVAVLAVLTARPLGIIREQAAA
jgi:branched-chain amino acid transport system permease protein